MKDKPTEFELITSIAFNYFTQEECDVVILEAGMGGRLDSTNIIDTPVLSEITGIALDHTAILGDTHAHRLFCGHSWRREERSALVAAVPL
jgi:dihydrofolate synthase/folylpolyglutamate synthase